MLPAHIFSIPLATAQKKKTSRAAQYPLSGKKRKRGAAEAGDDELQPSDSAPEAPRNVQAKAPTSIVLSPDEIHQCKVAGHPLDKPLPGGHFPHAAPPADVESDDALNTDGEQHDRKNPGVHFANVSIPKGAVRANSNLRQQHLAVITTMMHRCLLQGDFARAGRALGLLLRSEIGKGEYFDIRAEGRWGIGAEILLRRGEINHAQGPHFSSVDSNNAETAGLQGNGPSEYCFIEEGFEAAKDYYERLILQYPYRKSHPHAVSAITFYPALFSLWIYQVQGRSKQARERLHRPQRRRASHPPGSMYADSDEALDSEATDTGSDHHDWRSQENEARSAELRQALEIVARMDQIMVSPPYDKNVALLKLRGMVALWIADLRIMETQLDGDGVRTSSAINNEFDESSESIWERRRYEENLLEWRRDIDRARMCFQRAIDEGGEVPDGVKYFVDPAAGEHRE